MMRNYFLISLALLTSLFLTACHEKAAEKTDAQLKTVTAELLSVPTKLYYNGTVSPIQVYNITSPADGTIKQINFKYGEQVQANQLLLIINSAKLQDDYRTGLTNFLKAKQDYLNSIVNFQGTQALNKAQIISQQEYLNEKEQYENAVLTYLNAKVTLEQTIKKIPGVSTQLENLTLEDTATLNKILQVQYDSLPIVADHSGIVLFPQQNTAADSSGSDNSDGSSSSNKTLNVGSTVKEGQILVSVGDLSGIATTVQVSELAINNIKPGQAVTLTVEALPAISFKGQVTSVAAQAQASPDGQGGLATFAVVVVVPKITPQQAALIRVGMSATLEIIIQNPPQIMVPITAVSQKNGTNVVQVLDPQTQQVHEVTVTTGQTTLNQVTITGGVKAGDQVVVT